ncbi:MAG: hypothetical protein C4586_05945 [Anaerolineaceae bacterium]|nr:MAG: hypothetical protein C4586_05945 [Anaerolineaceae bacterium]
MPATNTITAFNQFTALTVIESAKVNANFALFRGNLLPVDPTISAAADHSYNLGSSDYRWSNVYLAQSSIFSSQTTTAISIPASGVALFNNNGTMSTKDSSGVVRPLGGATWKSYLLSIGALSFAGLTSSGTLFNADPKEIIHGYFIKHSTAFAGTSITALTLKVGLSAERDKYIPDFDIVQGVTSTAYYLANDFDMPSFDATTAVVWTAEATGGNLDNLSAGQVTINVLTSFMP